MRRLFRSNTVAIAVTGHRPAGIGNDPERQLWARRQLRKVLQRAISKYGAKHLIIITGMAIGTDQWWAEEALALGLSLHAYVPCKGQQTYWSTAQQRQYHVILGQADHVFLVSKGPYSADKMLKRNIAMCQRANVLVAVYNGSPRGGTAHCVRYWRKIHRKHILINPKTREIGWWKRAV